MIRQKNEKINDPDQYFRKLFYYYLEFLSRSDQYRKWLKLQDEITEEIKGLSFKIIPAKIDLKKKRKPMEPAEINKPVFFSSFSKNNQCIWDITKKFRCDFNRAILEIDIERPLEILKEQFEEIIKPIQKKYWSECKNENYYGEYRYLIDFMRDKKGKYKNKRIKTYDFDVWDKYLEIYDLKKERLSSREIAKKVFRDESPEARENKVNKYFSRAKKLINVAATNKFPPENIR